MKKLKTGDALRGRPRKNPVRKKPTKLKLKLKLKPKPKPRTRKIEVLIKFQPDRYGAGTEAERTIFEIAEETKIIGHAMCPREDSKVRGVYVAILMESQG